MQHEESSLEEKARTWIEKHGYPLEMKVMEILRGSGNWASHHRAYQDPETGKLREIDVLGYLDNETISVHLVFECKHTKDKPWVLFASPVPVMAPRAFPGTIPATPLASKIVEELCNVQTVQELIMFQAPLPLGFRLVKAHTDNQDAAFHAVRGLATSCHATAAAIGRNGHAVLYVPIIVVDAPLLECHLPPSEEKLQLKRIPRGTLLYRHAELEFTLVHIVTIDELAKFLDRLKQDSELLAKLASKTQLERSAT